MKYKKLQLIQKQISERLQKVSGLFEIALPVGGWVRSIRVALGMNTRQFAQRLGVSRQRVSELEKSEVDGHITLESMRRAAESLESVFVYAIVPRQELSSVLRQRAEALVRRRMQRVNHSMFLEKQGLPQKEVDDALNEAVETLLQEHLSTVWEDV